MVGRRGIARALAACAVVTSIVAAAVPLSLHLAPVRRMVATNVNRALAPVFAGRITVDRIGALGLTYVEGLDAHVDDADGRRVLQVEGARARVSTWTLVRSVLGPRGEIVVDVPELSVARVEATLDPDDSGTLRIARAFELRPDTSPGESARAVRVTLARVLVETSRVHVRPNAAPPLEVDVSGAEGSVRAAAGTVAIDLTRGPLVVRGLPGGVQAQGQVEAHLTQPSLRIHALWNGAVGTIHDQADVTYENGRVDAVLDVASASPGEMRAVWPACPLRAPSEAHAEAHGVLPRVDVSAHAVVGAAILDLAGPVVVGPNVQATLHLDGKGLDAQAILASAPRSDLAISGDVSVTARPTGAIEGRGTVALADGGVWGAIRLPPATVTGEFARSAAGEPSARVELTVRASGAASVVSARLDSKGGSPVVTFEGETTMARLEALAPLGIVATGSANARATGAIDLGANTLDAHLSATIAHLTARGASLDNARVEAHATGRLSSPTADIAIDGEGLVRGALRLSAVRAEGRMTLDDGVTIQNIRVDVTGDGEPAHARAALVRISQGSVRLDDAVVEQLGAPLTATVRASASGVLVQAKCAGVDLARLGTFVNVPVKRGSLSLDLDATVSAGVAQGRLAMDLRHAAFQAIEDANAHVEMALDGRHASGHATASIDDIGTLEFHSSSVDIGQGPLLTPSPWRRAWGAVQFGAHVDLARLARRMPPGAFAFDEILGTLSVAGQVARDSAEDATPGVELSARVTGLVLARTGGSRPWRIEGIDPTLHATVDGDTGSTAVQAEVRDAAGAIATLEAHSNAVPYAIFFSDDNPLDALRTMPFDARVLLGSRRLDSLPVALGLGRFGGDLEASVSWHGAVVRPAIDLTASLRDSHIDPALLLQSLDLSMAAHYDGARVDATLQAMSRGRRVLDASARLEARAPEVIAGLAGADVPWTASARAKLDQLPLQSIALLGDRQVRGKVSGQASIDGLHEDARSSLALTFDGLEVGGVPCRSSSMNVTMDGHTLDVSARLDEKDGFVVGGGRFGMRWGSAVTPVLDLSQPAQVSLSAKQLRAAFLLPFLSKWMTELDGRIDADVHAAIGAGGTVRPEGTVALRDGNFELTSFGGAFHGASAKLTLMPDGIVRLQDVVAKGISGSFQAAATARLDGFSLASVRASVVLPAKDPLPLVFDGVQMGMLDGGFEVGMDRRGANQAIDVVVDVRSAHLQLPSSSSSLDAQALGEVDGVTVGVRRDSGEFVEVQLDGSRTDAADRAAARRVPVQIAVRLSDMRVSRGTSLDVRLEGQPVIAMTDVTRVNGQIRMRRGSIDVYGKSFTIDHGTVTFVGTDPTNPQIVLTASWAAPDGVTRVFADFVGPLKTGKVRLRSEPSKSQSEVLALVLFGTTDDQRSSPGSASAQVSPAAAVAGGAATQPLNRALDNLGLAGGISTKIDTSQTNPRPEVEVQIARDISLQIAWVLGVPPPGTNPDSTLVTLDWHFLRKWSLETTIGDAGTSIVDVVWQHRY
jgi:translocation and assembly module TamB